MVPVRSLGLKMKLRVVRDPYNRSGKPTNYPFKFFRREGGTGIEYDELRPGLDIEFWWPYDEKNKQISTTDKSVGRFRKCKVISAKAISDERPPELEKENSKKSNPEVDKNKLENISNEQKDDEEIKQLLLSELDVSPKFFESPNWKEHLNSCLDLLLEDEESDPEEKELQVKAHKLNDYVMIT